MDKEHDWQKLFLTGLAVILLGTLIVIKTDDIDAPIATPGACDGGICYRSDHEASFGVAVILLFIGGFILVASLEMRMRRH